MRKIYLLLALLFLATPGFSTFYYHIVPNGRVDVLGNWNSLPTGGGIAPTTFATPGDVWQITFNTVDSTGTWAIGGTLQMISNGKITHETTTQDTIIVGGSITMANNSMFTSLASAGDLEIFVNVNLIMNNTSKFITNDPTAFNHIHFSGTPVYPANQLFTSNSTGASTQTSFFVESGSRLKLNTATIKIPTLSDSGFVVRSGGALICSTNVLDGQGTGTFKLYSNATIYTAHANGLDNTGSLPNLGSYYFDSGAHYVYNGIVPQTTGNYMPAYFVAPGSDTINNASGVTATVTPLDFQAGTWVSLEQGNFITSGAITMRNGTNIYVDNGNFDTNPIYDPFVNVTYCNLGLNALTVNTGFELIPTLPSTTIGKIIIDKPLATISLTSSPTANDSVIIKRGIMWAGFSPSYNVTALNAWINNSGTGGFNPFTGKVFFNGSALQHIGGLYSTNFNDLVLNNSNGVIIDTTEYILDTLNLVSGTITINNHLLVLESLAAPVQGSFSGSTMIIADSIGEVAKFFTSDAGYYFPIGDRGANFTPIKVTTSGGSYTGAAFCGVRVTPHKHPLNANVSNYLKRYWSVDEAAIGGTYTDTANYVAGDIVGSDTYISGGEIGGSLPWNKYGPADVGTKTISSALITGTSTSFSGISTDGPGITLTPDTLICGSSVDTIKVLSSSTDGPFTYSWAPSSGLSATTGTVAIASPSVTTTYTVTMTDGNGFTTSSVTTVSVNPVPSLSSVYSSSDLGFVCEGDTLFLFSTGAANVSNYSWVGPVSVTDSDQANPFIPGAGPSATGTYTVTVYDGMGIGCTATYTLTATVHPKATAITVTGTGTFCGSDTLTATSTAGDDIYYQWTTANAFSTDSLYSTYFAPIGVIVNGTGTYYFRPRTAFGCWGNQDSAKVIINPLPVDVLASPAEIAACDSTAISASGGSDGTIYYEGTTSGGTDMSNTTLSQEITTIGTNNYYFRIKSAAGCWGKESSSNVTINKHADSVKVTGGGTFCDHADVSIEYDGTDGATVFFQGTTSGGTDLSTPVGSTFTLFASGTYYFRAVSPAGCWGKEDTVSVVINPLPAMVNIFGASADCDSTLILADNGGDGTIYFQGTTANGTSTANPAISEMITTVGTNTYYFRAESSLGCWSVDNSITVTINKSPNPTVCSGSGGPFCGSTVITGDNGGDGTMWFQGMVSNGTDMSLGGSPQTVSASGTYYFRAVSTAGCWGFQDSATVTVNPLPLTFSMTGGGAYCAGGAGFHVGLSGSQLGVRYQLYEGASPLGGPLNGTGSALDFGNFTDQAVYTAVATDTTTGCTNPMDGNAQIIVNPLPVQFILGPDTGRYCIGGSGIDLTLSGSEPTVTYYIYNGPTLVNVVDGATGFGFGIDLGYYTGVGVYSVSAISDSGCTSNMTGTSAIFTNPLPNVYMVSGGGAYCVGDTGYHVFLSGSELGFNYDLYNSGGIVGSFTGDGNPIDFGLQTAAGTYTVIATNTATGCNDNMDSSATIIVNLLPNVYSISGGGAYCSGGAGTAITLSGSDAGINYKLYNGTTLLETVPGTGTPPLDFGPQTLAGIYTAIAVDAVTGCSDTMFGATPVSINALPTAFTIFGGGDYCIGGIGYNVGVSGSETGKSYTLYKDGVPVGSPSAGTGAIIYFGYQTAAGVYSVIATDTTTGCTRMMAGTTTIVVNPLPIIYSVTGGGHYCSGGTGVHVDLSGSNIGISYQLHRDAALVGGLVPGTGSYVDFGLLLPTGHYWATAVNVITGCADTMHDSVMINVNPLPTPYAVTGGGSYCVGGTGLHIGLGGSNLGIVYQLFNGTVAVGGPLPGTDSALDFGLMTGAGTYTVIARDTATGCVNIMTGSKNISINPLPPVHLLTGGGSVTYCLGDTGIHIGLTATDLGIRYQLYNGTTPVGDPVNGTGSPIDFGPQTIGGTYTVIATDTTTGCVSTMSGSSVITVNPPVIPTVTLLAHPSLHIGVGSRDTLVAVVSGIGTYATYQWYINGNLVPGATNDTFSFEVYFNTDSISCEVTSHGPCGGHTTNKSVFISLFDVSVNQVSSHSSDIRLMPNPNKGTFSLKGSLGTTNDQELNIEITDMLGQVIYKDHYNARNGVVDDLIQLNGDLANGMYLLNLKTSTESNVIHFVIEQ